MTRTFIQTHEFSRRWDSLGLMDDDLRRLELMILEDPQAGKVIPGTGKLRKLRFAFGNKGKRGSARVCYVDFVSFDTVYLITVYAKSEKSDLTQRERHQVRSAIEVLEASLKGARNDGSL